MSDDPKLERDRRTLARLLKSRGADWITENMKGVARPRSGRPPEFHRYDLASIWAVIDYRTRRHHQTVEQACKDLRSDMVKTFPGYRTSWNQLRARYYEARRERENDAALNELMKAMHERVRATATELKKRSRNFIIMPLPFLGGGKDQRAAIIGAVPTDGART